MTQEYSDNLAAQRLRNAGLLDHDGPIPLPQYTTTARDALTAAKGMLIFNTTTNKVNVYTGSAWEAVTSA